ncbi:MAG: purine-nucleoside phosphorylase [Bacteroidales bacterium]|nr:purine-nucleoside phosphorylase [Candidatus Cryptobacteroides aphodequi]
MSDPRMQIIREAASYIESRLDGRKPIIGIILGSGLGDLGSKIEDAVEINYADIPNFPLSTAIGHKSSMLIGRLGGKCVLAMQGRFHFYEGYSMEQITLPIRVMSLLGIGTLLVSNAAGGTNPEYEIGDLMVIRDHISFHMNPLIGKNYDEFGPRFPDMTCAYDSAMIEKAHAIAKDMGITLREGIYTSCTGPCYETPAELRYFRAVGSDAVGMSTIPEVIVARHCGMKVFGVSVITDLAHDDMPEDYVTDEVAIVVAATRASGRMTILFERLIETLEN